MHERNVEQARRALEHAETCFENDGRKLELTKSQLLLAATYYQDNKNIDARLKIKKVLNSEMQTKHPIIVLIRQARTWLEGLQSDPEVGWALRDLLNKANQIDKKMPEIRRRIRRLARTMDVPMRS